ncbi:MAG: citrate transporter [Firmicutes bacterium]|nr:citrate transporter [Bacillota bacterium]
MTKLKEFFKKETVFCIAALAALISAFFTPPSMNYITYIDFRVLFMLFSLMSVVEGLSRLGVFTRCAEVMVSKANNLRLLVFVLWGLCFFSAMLITNDVALITFVPLAITVLTMTNSREYIIRTVVLQTAAANLGSMLTPLGNPQNLYLYNYFNVPAAVFFKITLPCTAISFALLFVSTFVLIKNKKTDIRITKKTKTGSKKLLALYCVLAVLCLLSVGKVTDAWMTALIVLVSLAIADNEVLYGIDRFLLLTFVMFFIFVGNIAAMDGVKNAHSQIIECKELVFSVLLSQVISNVPCAAMLSGFTDNYRALILGTNIGGLGTLVASLASLISYRIYCAEVKDARRGKYILHFSIVSIIFLLILLFIYGIVL